MLEVPLLWLGTWMILLVIFLIILYRAKNRKPYLLCFIFGMAFGFYFDIASFTLGYYSYPGFFPLPILGIPFSMTIAEGFCVVIAVRIFEAAKHLLRI